jgi:predicted permease
MFLFGCLFQMWDFFLCIICTKSTRCTEHKHTIYCSTSKKKSFTSVTNFIALGSSMSFYCTCMQLPKWMFVRELTSMVAVPVLLFTITIARSLQLLVHDNVWQKGAKSYFLMLLRGELETNIQVCSRHACSRKMSYETVITSLLLSSLLLLLLASHSPNSRSHWWHQTDRSTSVHAIGQTAVSNGI